MVSTWAPGHATLFFSTPEKRTVPKEMGSIGGGLNFEAGITTEINLNGNNKVYWNGNQIDGKVTLIAIQEFERQTGINCDRIDVLHTSKLPIGYGISTSGAGAIGTALGLNELFNANLSRLEVFEIAHYADVVNHTGLGSVVGQMVGGIELRLTQGGPTVCKTKKYNASDELVLVFYGPLSTVDVLTSEEQMRLVTNAGLETLKALRHQENISLIDMIHSGYNFTTKCGLETPRIESKIKELEDIGEDMVSMAMIGETLIIKPNHIAKLTEKLQKDGDHFLITKISNDQPKIIS